MGKVDRCEKLKKEAANVRRRVVAQTKVAERNAEKEAKEQERLQEERLAEERAKAKQSGPTRFERAMQDGNSNSTFARASKVVGQVEESGSEHGEEDVTAGESSPTQRTTQPKKEERVSKKKQQAARHLDEITLLTLEQKAARQERIKMRLLRMLGIGLFLEAYRDRGSKPAAKAASKESGKGKKKGASAGQEWSVGRVRETLNVYGGPILMVLFTLALFGARIMGEDFVPDQMTEDGVNHYEVMGVASDVDSMGLRKAYKALALSWHPDKNPGCEACAAKFSKISQAYEVLSNAETRKAYDQRRAPDGSLESMSSVDLTGEDFEVRVLRSNEVWFVQVYDPTDGFCNSFHPLWEDIAHKYANVAKFGRLDAVKHRRALGQLPQRVGMVPLVWRFARGLEPALFMPSVSAMEEGGSAPLGRFVQDSLPKLAQISSQGEFQSWWNRNPSRPKTLILSPAVRRGSKSEHLMQLQRAAQLWGEFSDIRISDAKTVKLAGAQAPGSNWTVAVKAAGPHGVVTEEVMHLPELRDVPNFVQDTISRLIVNVQAPHVTVRNHQQLCGPHGGLRTYCLILVNAPKDGDKALDELNSSRTSFLHEVQELRSSDEDATEEPFHVQPARVSTSSSRLPWLPVAAGPSFYAVWAEAEKAPAFILELETRRIAPVKTSSLRELYQQIAYDEMKFKELSEGISLVRALPDPEVPLRREMLHILTTLPGGVSAWLLLAVSIAIVPELSLVTGAAVVGAGVALIVAAWPLASRRALGLLV